MGACFGKGAEGRRVHMRGLILRMGKLATWHPDELNVGDEVEAEWQGEWYTAFICVVHGKLVDICWEDGSFTPSISVDRIRRVHVRITVGDTVSVKLNRPGGHQHGGKKSYRLGVVVQVTGKGYDVRWPDGSTATSVRRADMKPVPRGILDPEHYRLHGRFDIMCVEARGLPNGDGFACLASPGDPYCEVSNSRGTVIARSEVMKDTCNPQWNFVYNHVSVPDSSVLHFAIKDSDVQSNELLCETVLCCHNGLAIVAAGRTFAGWLPLRDSMQRKAGELFVAVKLVPPEFEPLPHEVVGARFPMHQYHRVTLYQSAHVGSWAHKLAALPGGYRRANCWEDVATRIMQAKHLIYITGWSVNPATRLLRERPIHIDGYGTLGTERTLGDMLVEQANNGVAVCVLIWKEKTSRAGEGLAGTGSGQAIEYFRNTNVMCAGVYRDAKRSRTNKLFETWLITHHQKAVVCDVASPADPSRRGLTAFIGGLDLTTGRWDNPGKEIFSTLDTYHSDDFYQTMLETPAHIGPRQPWQDIHSQIQGPTAYDIAMNFENRWMTQAGHMKDALFGVARSGRLLGPMRDVVADDESQWNVQLYRSITSNSDYTTRGVEADCHKAWIDAIMGARRHIYIENQYFMGMSDYWDKGRSTSTASNRIAEVITDRIIAAIRRSERFAVYIVVPLFPEGDPCSKVMQEIVYWQCQTVSAMYAKIGKVLTAMRSAALPTDYLNFFTLGQKKPGEVHLEQPLRARDKSRFAQVVTNGRIPIYVHSKLIIVDDTLFVVGSCNVNDRSMSGDRDTEIAVGMYQPERGDRGDVHAFRLSLWTEHLNIRQQHGVPVCLTRPESLECVRWVNNRAVRAWKAHAGDNPREPQPCHLMKYPYIVKAGGQIAAMQHEIPDAPGAKTLGEESLLVPDFLTS